MTPVVVYDYTKDWIYDENAPWTTSAMGIKTAIYTPKSIDCFIY